MLIVVLYYSQLDIGQYKPALALIDTLLTELKRLDDKMILTEVHLLESRVHRGTGNFPKAKVCGLLPSTPFRVFLANNLTMFLAGRMVQ